MLHDGAVDLLPKTIWKVVGVVVLTGCLCLSVFPLLAGHPELRNFLVILGLQLLLFTAVAVMFFGRKWGLWEENQSSGKADERDIAITKNALLGFTIFGLLAICVLALSSATPFSWLTTARIIGFGFLYAAAFFAAGALIGFLFGIPRSIASTGKDDKPNTDGKSADNQQARYKTNTNLEDISDWLTKIIVGLGLINLKVIPGKLKTAAWFFANFCGKDYCEPIAMALIIYFSICGFFLAYLMTRLFLTGAFTRADQAAAGGTVDPTSNLVIKNFAASAPQQRPQGQMRIKLDTLESSSSISGGDII
jgi:hypothetical protein